MPKVPTLTRRQVETAPLPGVRLTPERRPEQFGKLTGPLPNLAGPIRLAQEAYDAARDEADREAFVAADTQAGMLSVDLEREVTARQGREALTASDDALRRFDEGVSKIRAGLATERQRGAFQRSAETHRLRLYAKAEQHAATQARQQQVETYEAALTLRRTLAQRATTPEERAQLVEEGKALIATYGVGRGGQGWTTEQLATATAAWVSGTHAAVLQGMLAADRDLDARAYWQAYEAEIVGPARPELERAVRVGSTLGESQRQADAIIRRPGITRGAAFEAARGIADPEVRKETEERLDVEFRRRDQARAEQHETLVQDSWNRYVEGSRRPPAHVWMQYTPDEKQEADRRIRQRVSGEPATTDWAIYYDLKTKAARPETRAEFLNTNLLQYRSRLGEAEWKDVLSDQMALRAAGPRAEERDRDLAVVATQEQVVNTAMTAAGLDPTPTTKAAAARTLAFRRSVWDAVAELQRSTGKKATTDQVQQVVDDLLVKQVRERLLLPDEERFGFELSFEDVPATERQQAAEALRELRIPVTETAILQLYRRRLRIQADSARAQPRR